MNGTLHSSSFAVVNACLYSIEQLLSVCPDGCKNVGSKWLQGSCIRPVHGGIGLESDSDAVDDHHIPSKTLFQFSGDDFFGGYSEMTYIYIPVYLYVRYTFTVMTRTVLIEEFFLPRNPVQSFTVASYSR